jgi:hypothetical protein
MALRRGVASRAWAEEEGRTEDEEGEEEEEEEEAFLAEAGAGLGVAWLVSWLGRRGAAGEEGGREEPLPFFALCPPRLLRRGGLRAEEVAEEEASSSMMTLEGEARFSLSSNETRRRDARLPPAPPSNPSATRLAAARSFIT